MRKKFYFGKITYSNPNRKANAVTVEVELRLDRFERPVFSACGTISGGNGRGCVCAGQCLDEIAKYRHQLRDASTFNFIYAMWKKYHLNDTHSGTPEQEVALKEWEEAGNKYDYTEACKYLESIGMYEVEYHGIEFNGMYKYGHGWLYQPIEKEDLDKIVDLFK